MKVTTQQRKALQYSAIMAALLLLLLLWQFFAAVAAACIAAVIFIPAYEWLVRKTGREGLSVLLTTLFSIAVILVPIAVTVWVSVDQVQDMITVLDERIDESGVVVDSGLIDSVNERLDSLTDGNVQISLAQIQESALTAAKAIGEATLNFITSTASSIPALVTSIIIYFYVFLALLGNYKKLIVFLRKLNPLGDEVSHLFLTRAKAMTDSMVKGQFVVAVIQGIVGALSFQAAGLGYFSFFALLLSLLSIIPLGGGIIAVPLGIILLLFGNVAGGLIILLTHFIIVTNIDNFIRPKLVPKELSLNSALIMISVFAGLALFGFLGIVVGPVLLIIAITTLQVYAKVSDKDNAKVRS